MKAIVRVVTFHNRYEKVPVTEKAVAKLQAGSSYWTKCRESCQNIKH